MADALVDKTRTSGGRMENAMSAHWTVLAKGRSCLSFPSSLPTSVAQVVSATFPTSFWLRPATFLARAKSPLTKQTRLSTVSVVNTLSLFVHYMPSCPNPTNPSQQATPNSTPSLGVASRPAWCGKSSARGILTLPPLGLGKSEVPHPALPEKLSSPFNSLSSSNYLTTLAAYPAPPATSPSPPISRLRDYNK